MNRYIILPPPHGLALVLKSDRRQGCIPPRGDIFGVAAVLKLDRRQGSVTNAKTPVRGGGGGTLYGVIFFYNCYNSESLVLNTYLTWHIPYVKCRVKKKKEFKFVFTFL